MAFRCLGLDVVGPLTKSSGGHLYILAATNFLSKWAEAVPLKEVKKENVADFIRTTSFYHFTECLGISLPYTMEAIISGFMKTSNILILKYFDCAVYARIPPPQRTKMGPQRRLGI
ncbi:UNVERIFIED_CONTAM: hypothetical protein Sangu_0481200 [Sesamum angustifolium]|uniref:Uncharacterized protein n=1 Tax=Sesamum angustifolium TaxID=2727405 RepID=A0AAW2Q7U4_9LAMI